MKKLLTAILRFMEWLMFLPREDNPSPSTMEAEVPQETPLEGNLSSAKRLREGIQVGFPHDALRRWGCYFFVLLRWSEEITGRGVREEDIVPLFERASAQTMPEPNDPSRRIPVVTKNCFVNDPVRLLNFLAGETAVRKVSLRTNDRGHPIPTERIFVAREKHPRHGAHFVLVIDGQRWDSWPLAGRQPEGFRVLT